MRYPTLLTLFGVLFVISMIRFTSNTSTFAKAASVNGIWIGNDSGVVGGTYDGLVGRRSLAVRIERPVDSDGLCLDALRIHLAPQEGITEAKLFVRLESTEGEFPATENPIETWRITTPLDTARWYSLPVEHMIKPDDPKFLVISFKSEDFPWNPAPLIMLDDRTHIPDGYNFYGDNFSNWLEHYQYWPYPDEVGNIMLRIHFTTDAYPAETPSPPSIFRIWLPMSFNE